MHIYVHTYVCKLLEHIHTHAQNISVTIWKNCLRISSVFTIRLRPNLHGGVSIIHTKTQISLFFGRSGWQLGQKFKNTDRSGPS